MKKKILAAVLCICVAVQSMEFSVSAAETYRVHDTMSEAGMQEEYGRIKEPGAGEESGTVSESKIGEEKETINESEIGGENDTIGESETKEEGGTVSEPETGEEGGRVSESESGEDSETISESEMEEGETVSESEPEEGEGVSESETVEEKETIEEPETEEDGAISESENGEENGTWEESGTIDETGDSDETVDELNDIEQDAEEMVGEPMSLNLEEETALQNQYGQPADTDLVSAMASAKVNGLEFEYSVEDSKARTGVLKKYLSEADTIVLPHKLGGYYMVGIGDSAFYGIDNADQTDLSKLPKQSTSGMTVLSDGEERILELVNELRTQNGRKPLVMHTALREAARCKSLDMLNKSYFSHENTDGTFTYDWLTKCGYPWRMWAENIAYNYSSAEALFEQWKNSPGHYANMMNPDLRAIGIGVYKNSSGKIMGTQVFSDTIFQNLVNVTIEYGYEKIGNNAFGMCTNLEKITIPSTVTEISETAFTGCSKLTIYGKAGSYAEEYAETKNITFHAVEEVCPVKEFRFEEEEIFMEEGDMDCAKLTVKPADYTHLVRISEKPAEEIVFYKEDGTLRAIKDGETLIKAELGDLQAQCRIKVGTRTFPASEIRFFDEELVLYVGESIRPAYYIAPLNTTDEVKMTASNETVFVVNDDGTITAKAAGQAALTISAGEVSDTLKVKVQTVKEDLVLPQNLTAVVNIEKTLADVSLKDYPGFSWKEPNTKLKAKKNEPVQYFAAQYKEGDLIVQDCLVPIEISSVTGMTAEIEAQTLVSGKKISLQENQKLQFGVKATGACVDSAYFDVECTVDKPELATIKGDGENWILQPQNSGKVSITVVVRLKDKNGGYGPEKKPYGTYKKKYVFQIENSVYVNEFLTELVPDAAEGVQILEDRTLVVEEGIEKFCIRVNAFDGNGKQQDTELAFSAGKSKVLQVKASKEERGLAEVTVKRSGEATITVKAKDNGKRTIQLKVLVKDLTPQLTGKVFTLNKYKPTVTASIELKAAQDNPIRSVALFDDAALQSPSVLFILQKTEDSYSLGIRNAEDIKKGTYKQYLRVTTQNKEYVFPITVKLKNTKPSVTWKQMTKPNLFYKDTSAQLQIKTGKENAVKIEQVNVRKDVPHFEAVFEKKDGVWYGTIYPVGVTSQNYKKVNKKLELRFDFEDYGSDCSVTKSINIGYVYKKPVLTSAPTESMVYLGMGNDQAVFHILNKTENEVLIPGGEGTVTVNLENGMENKVQMEVVPGNQDITLRLLGKKSQTVKTLVSHDNWQEPVKCSFKLKVNNKVPSLTLEKTKITLNSREAGKETIVLNAAANKNENVAVVRLKEADIIGCNAAAQKLLDDGKLSICPQKEDGKRRLEICLNDSSVKNGTYKFKIYGWCMSGDSIQRMNPATLSIVVTNKKPAVSLKAKGKIGSGITYVPKITNVNGRIEDAVLCGSYASAFQLTKGEDGNFQIRLRENAVLGKGSYKLYFVFYLDNGVRIESKEFTMKI